MRKSAVHDLLIAAGADIDETGLARSFPGGPRAAGLDELALIDLSPLPRTGVKGGDAMDWLTGQGLVVGAAANRAWPQASGLLALKLSPAECLVLGSLDGAEAPVAALDRALASPDAGRCYGLPRRDTHAWFLIVGRRASDMFAKLCAVDLRPRSFADHAVAQTTLAGVSTIIVRDDAVAGAGRSWHLLCDSAAAVYMARCLLDAMGEFGGGLCGFDALSES